MSEGNKKQLLGPLDNLTKVFRHSYIQIQTLNKKVKATFSPIRLCVKKCSSELENISEMIEIEQEAIEQLNEKFLGAEVFTCFKTSFNSSLEHQQFLAMLDARLNTYLKEVVQTKAAISQIYSLFHSSKADLHREKYYDNTGIKIEEINERLYKLEGSIRQLKSGINDGATIVEVGSIESENEASAFRHGLIAVLENIDDKSHQQLQLTEQSLKNLKELSTYLQFEDIIGQKLEHIAEILNLIIGGLAQKEFHQSQEDSPYYTLIPELSALTISHLNLVHEEYHRVVNAVINNASSVKDNLDQIGLSTSASMSEIEHKLKVINDIYQSLESSLKKLFDEDFRCNRLTPSLENYFSAILNNTQSVFDQIRSTDLLKTDCSDHLIKIQNIMKKIYNSITETLIQKKHSDEQLHVSINEFRKALDGFHHLSQSVISNDTRQKLILNQKSKLSESLSSQLEANLIELDTNNILDRIISECKDGLIEFAQNVGGRELTEKEVNAYHGLREIYSMESERKVHETNLKEMGILPSGKTSTVNQDSGSIELF